MTMSSDLAFLFALLQVEQHVLPNCTIELTDAMNEILLQQTVRHRDPNNCSPNCRSPR